MQDKRYALTAKALAEDPEALRRYSKELHLPEASLNKLASLETARPSQHLSIQACLGAGACEAVKDLYLGALDSSTVASIVALNRLVDDPTALLTGIPGVTVLNQADTISSALMRYREMATTYTSLVYIVVFLLLIWRYGASHAVWILVPPTLGGGAALAALALCGIPINVFSVFALLVLIGLSIDYAIFCAEDAATAAYTNFAVLLSAITTAISFGLLSFSSTPALRSFGVVLSVGVIVAALVAPVATRPVPTRVRGGRSQVLLLTVLLISSGCALSLPAPKISTSVASDAGLFMRLCPVAARRAQRRVSDNRPLIAALECSTSSGVIVVLNGYGLRVQTVTLQQDGQLRSEVSYLAEEAVEAEQLVRRFLAT
jgi:hypothetical protein